MEANAISMQAVRPSGATRPMRSVRASILAGFGLLVVILGAVVAGSIWLVQDYQASSAEMQQRADTASLLQEVESNASIAALLMQRYVVAGDENLPAEITASASTAVESLTLARSKAAAAGYADAEKAQLDGFVTSLTALAEGAQGMIALRQNGKVPEAGATLEKVVPVFRQFRLDLMAAADSNLTQVADLQNRADRAGNLALWLLVISGIAGLSLGALISFLIARSIIRPLAALEATAVTASAGDMSVRAPAGGPRELARVGAALNGMMTAVQERTKELLQTNWDLKQSYDQLVQARAQAASDPLTGLLNHRKFHESIREVIEAAGENGQPVGVIMLDVDNFKQVNDSLGHQAGDKVLRDLAAALQQNVDGGSVFRYGGDEFVVLLSGSDSERTTQIAQQLLEATRPVGADSAEAVTITLGVAAYPEMASTAEELVYRADMALNWAKSAGKNQVGDWNSLILRKDDAAGVTEAKLGAETPS